MRANSRIPPVLVLLALALLLLVPAAAQAYVGPGAGLELIPYFLGLLAWVGLALSSVLLYPFLALLRRLRKGTAEDNSAPQKTDAVPPEAPIDNT